MNGNRCTACGGQGRRAYAECGQVHPCWDCSGKGFIDHALEPLWDEATIKADAQREVVDAALSLLPPAHYEGVLIHPNNLRAALAPYQTEGSA